MMLQCWWLVLVLLLIWVYSRVRSRFCVATRGKVRTMIILGSGGHTAEMLSYVNILTHEYSPQIYVLASSDQMSEAKLLQLMQLKETEYILERIPRAREVRQPFLSSTFSTIRGFMGAFPLIFRHRPDLILCNGPGTCIPVCFVAYFLCVLFWRPLVIVYVESICRTKTLSVSGRLLYYTRFTDIIVQWPELQALYPRSKYLGLLS
ncbi:hypothetical protein P879_04772 [Paragonimus westermani]|uniref:UDP-N-acetylglucosamine transferase subunit ALG14 n=1 Tax=Paragonimus westermani TaxID=34504 RepID=A0A8T0DFK1_9TREM|nr:hypothetical protein P879_04772 [Paragonimus westermani]